MSNLKRYTFGKKNGFAPEVELFLTNSGQTDTLIADAVNYVINALINNNLWNNILVFYPNVGLTAFNHKFNAKAPFDNNASFRQVYYGTGTHDANGYTGNGTNAYSNTFFNRQLFPMDNSFGSLICVGTNNTTNGYACEFGATDGGGTLNEYICVKNNDSGFDKIAKLNNAIINVQNGNDANGIFIINKKTNPNNYKFWRNGLQIGENTTGYGGLSAYNLYTNCINVYNSFPAAFSKQRLQSIVIFRDFSDNEVILLNQIIDIFENMLTRKTW